MTSGARTRSEYRLRPDGHRTRQGGPAGRHPTDDDRSALAALLLDAFRGTIDDEGEGEAEALDAIDHYLDRIDRARSLVVEEGDRLVAMCFVLDVEGVRYVDPIAVAPSHKARGLGGRLVSTVLDSLWADGTDEVGAVITDGNTPSERLFVGLGFTRVGPWG